MKRKIFNTVGAWMVVLWMLMLDVQAQDLHFSQWFNSPLTTNPANTGFIPDADYRVGVQYRSQWNNIMSQPYRTMSAYGDVQLMRDRFENGWLGLGGVILTDKAGLSALTSNKMYASLAYHQMLGLSSLISAGFNVGWAQKRIDVSKLTFPGSVYNKLTGLFEAGIPPDVQFAAFNTSYMDVQVGVNYAYFPSENIYLNGGFSVHHLNRPRETFFDDSDGFDNRLAPRYIGFANASIKMNDMVILNPQAYYTQQAGASEFVIGGMANYNLSGDGSTQLSGGLYYRSSDAFIPMVGFQWKHVKLDFSYDATTSTLRNYNGMQGAYEFALTWKGFFDEYNGDKRQSLCPKF
jgi:type IX secretion system PorP/SprF family membrane protein